MSTVLVFDRQTILDLFDRHVSDFDLSSFAVRAALECLALSWERVPVDEFHSDLIGRDVGDVVAQLQKVTEVIRSAYFGQNGGVD